MIRPRFRVRLYTTLIGSLSCLASLTFVSPAAAGSCGLVGTATACSVDVGGLINFSFTNFTFLNSATSGGGVPYGANDIAIDLVSGGGLTALLTFDKPASSSSTVYLANAGETTSFTFSYDLTATALVPGSIAFASTTTSYVRSFLGNGLSTVQQIVAGQVNCFVSNTTPTRLCPVTGSGPLDVGNIVTLVGNTGNTSILEFSNLFEATFTPAAPSDAAVPEPATLMLVAVGLGLTVAMRRRRVA